MIFDILISTMDSIDISKYFNLFVDWAVLFAPRALAAILIIFVGLKLIKKLNKYIKKGLEKSNVGVEIVQFMASTAEMVAKIVLILFAASIIGIKFSALFGILAAAGFAVGLALQGFLGNFASGLTIIFFRPYKVGDWVSIADTFGKVEGIQIFNTSLVTPGDKTLIIPNGQVTDNIIVNFSTRGRIRLELKVTMPYEESFPRVKSIILEAMKKVTYIHQAPETIVGIESYDSHNVQLAIRPYIDPDHYWEATFEVYGVIKNAFQENGVKVAYSEGVELGKIGA